MCLELKSSSSLEHDWRDFRMVSIPKLVVTACTKRPLERVGIPADVLLVTFRGQNVSQNPWSIRDPEVVVYLDLLLKMQRGDPTKSRATHYIQAYELKLGRTTTLAETNISTPFTEQPIVDVQKTTISLDETAAREQEGREQLVSSLIKDATHTGGVDTLKDFLSKPTVLATGVFQTSDIANTPLAYWTLPQSLIAKAIQLTKLKGVMMFRADFEITLKTNATRFQQGRYLLRWIFTGGGNDTQNVTHNMIAHIASLTNTTSANCVSIDLATQTTVSFTIPYVGVANYSLSDYNDDYSNTIARLYLIPYDPLQAGSGVTTAQYTLWARMTNITTSGNVVLQSQSNIRLEQKSSGIGPVSGAAAKISKTASIFGSIPILAPYASSVSWLSDMVGSAAKVWGYSKPISLDPAKTMVRRVQPSMANTDQAFAGHKLSAMSVQEVPKSTGRSGTDLDEMSFQYIAGHFAWIKTVNWSNTQTSGVLLTTLKPGLGTESVSIGKGIAHPPCDYIAQMFTAYRGSVKYRLTIPKTEFHSGRLLVAFVPWDGSFAVTAPTTIADTDNLFRVVWDVRESNELEVEIPFVSTRNFTNIGREYGYVYIMVLNELMAPSTVPSSVNILIEKCAGDGIEYAAPFRGFYNQDTWPEPYVQYQSKPVVLGNAPAKADILAVESFGEKIVSARALLKRFSTFYTQTAGGFNSIDIYPFAYAPTCQSTSLAGPLVRTNIKSDLINWFSALYAMSSGGVRFNVMIDGYTGTTDWGIYGVVNTPTAPVSTGSSVFVVPQTPVQSVTFGVEGCVSLEVPQYTLQAQRSIGGHAIFNSSLGFTVPNYLGAGALFLIRGVFPTTIDTAVNKLRVHRAAADDFSLSVYNGTVPVVFSNTA